MSQAFIPKMAEMLHPQNKEVIDKLASQNPDQMPGLFAQAAQIGDPASQFYIAKNYLSLMPTKLHTYLSKLVTVTELMESDTSPPDLTIAGMLLDLTVENRLATPQAQGMPAELVEFVTCLELGIRPGTPRINAITWLEQNGSPQGGTVEVGAEAEAAAKAGGLNINSLVVEGNGTKH